MKLTLYFIFMMWPLLMLGKGTVVLPGKVFTSPDKTKSVKLLDFDRAYHYAITDKTTGKVTVLDCEHDPVFAIEWSGDSKSIYVVAHVARGSTVQILHLLENKWIKFNIDPPEEGNCDSDVLNWNIKPTLITLFCKVGLERANGTNYAYYKCSFDVDPATGVISRLNKSSLTREGYEALESNFVP